MAAVWSFLLLYQTRLVKHPLMLLNMLMFITLNAVFKWYFPPDSPAKQNQFEIFK